MSINEKIALRAFMKAYSIEGNPSPETIEKIANEQSDVLNMVTKNENEYVKKLRTEVSIEVLIEEIEELKKKTSPLP
ncbi:MAG: hypothetical protein QCH99_03695 [Candidatus Bathyarchaeota archaeon]|nr:hypothetical protein [Candidatus Bathyarchaeum tardum]